MTRMCEGCGAHIFEPQEPCPACGREQPTKVLSGRKKLSPAKKAAGELVGLLLMFAVTWLVVWLATGFSFKRENLEFTFLLAAGYLVLRLLVALLRRLLGGKRRKRSSPGD